MRRFLAFMVILTDLLGLVSLGSGLYMSRRAAIREGEALALKDKALAVFDSLAAIQCIPQHAGDRIVVYKAPRH